MNIKTEQILNNGKKRDTIIDMYKTYLYELNAYREDKVPNEEIKDIALSEIDGAIENPYTILNLIYYHNEPVGFIMIGIEDNSYDYNDYYIQEFYIDKKFRRKGIGSQVIKFITENIGEKNTNKNFSMFILYENKPALSFWSATFGALQFVNVGETPSYPKPFERFPPGHLDDLEFRYYVKN